MRRLSINAIFLHQLPDVKELFAAVARQYKLLPAIVEKDYWLMHCLWGIKKQGFQFELKGGTSLSKGFGIIERFSEDVDIQFHPSKSDNVKIGKNQDKPAHIIGRKLFFDKIANELKMPGLIFSRDYNFDDTLKMRSAGIRAEYSSLFANVASLKEGIVLELGFDQTVPNIDCKITSWALEKALTLNLPIIDSRVVARCYAPEYTFVEKLQTISTKYRLQQENRIMPINFLRHYYDIYKLLENERVLNFIGSNEYIAHKTKRFRAKDEENLNKNLAFTIPDRPTRELYAKEFRDKSAMYFGKQPEFNDILKRIFKYINQL